MACATYVDNFAVIGRDPSLVSKTLYKIIGKFDDLKVPTHEQTQAVTHGEFVGLSFENGFIRVKKYRLWTLGFALDEIISRKHGSGKTLEVLLGHLTWAMMLRREALCLFVHIYDFC